MLQLFLRPWVEARLTLSHHRLTEGNQRERTGKKGENVRKSLQQHLLCSSEKDKKGRIRLSLKQYDNMYACIQQLIETKLTSESVDLRGLFLMESMSSNFLCLTVTSMYFGVLMVIISTVEICVIYRDSKNISITY